MTPTAPECTCGGVGTCACCLRIAAVVAVESAPPRRRAGAETVAEARATWRVVPRLSRPRRGVVS